MEQKIIYSTVLLLVIFVLGAGSAHAQAQGGPDSDSGTGGYQQNGTRAGDDGEHDLPNGVKYYDNGTIVAKMHGHDSKFHFNKRIIFNPGGTAQNPDTPDPVLDCTPPSNTTYALARTSCGLVESDPLNNSTMTQQQMQANQRFWVYGGDAIAEGAPYSFSRNSSGLHVGVQAPARGTYAGFYAVTPDSNATLYHAVLTAPMRTIPLPQNDTVSSFQNGLYVQTSQPVVNYVTCVSVTNTAGTIWLLVNTYGNADQALAFNVLWADNSQNQPLTRDCTIITNGSNYLEVYMDGVQVYSSSTLDLKMPMPFNSFLEPQSSYAGQLLSGTYVNYYQTLGGSITVENAPQGAQTAGLVDTSGKTLASSTVSSGRAALGVGMYAMPLDANLVLYGSGGSKLASTSADYNVYGGDVFSIINGTVLPLPPTGLVASAQSYSEIGLSWAAPHDNGGPVVTGYVVERSADNGTTWSGVASVGGTSYVDQGLEPAKTYLYRVHSSSSAGHSAPSGIASAATPTRVEIAVQALDQYGNAIPDLWISVAMPDGTTAGAFTPAAFNASMGMAHTLTASGFGNTTFGHWDGGSTSPTRTVIPKSDMSLVAHYNVPPRYAISRTSQGLVASDLSGNSTLSQQQLLSQNGYWTFGGTAQNGTFDMSEDQQGLHIGVLSHAPGSYDGYYAAGQQTGAALFHSVITAPTRQINATGQDFQAGMYVENLAAVNYVTCVAITNENGTYWSVVSATGDLASATQYAVLWSDQSQGQPLTRDCTVITNGSNYLRVYLDGVQVYSSNSLSLQLKTVSSHVKAILDSESSYGALLGGTYRDYYAASSEAVSVSGLPANSTSVQLVAPSGAVLTSAHVASGSATIRVGMYHMPVVAYIRAVDGLNQTMAVTSSAASIYGGDAYVAGPAG